MNKLYLFILVIVCLGCKKENTSKTAPVVFSVEEEVSLSQTRYPINEDYLAKVQGIQCNDSCLIIVDYHSGYCFTLFDLETGKYIGRFGEIGQGPGELPGACGTHLSGNRFDIHSMQTGLIATYDVNSLLKDIQTHPTVLTHSGLPFEVQCLSGIVPLNDSVFFAAGFYAPKYQYVIFDNKKEVLDYNIDVYNAWEGGFGTGLFRQMLGNQGRLRKRPGRDQFVYFVNNSSNLDFIEVKQNKIIPIHLLRKRDPSLKSVIQGTSIQLIPELDCPVGYVDIAVSEDFVYALHTNNDITHPYCSDIVYVFDWEGHLVKQYKLDEQAYYLTVNKKRNKLYTAIRLEDGGWSMTSYDLI